MLSGSVAAVVFDLDDTLYPQSTWLAGAFDRVAATFDDITRVAVRRALDDAVAATGSDGGHVIDLALAACGVAADVAPLIDVLLAHRPERLEPFPGVVDALAVLRRRLPLGLVTDGDPAAQHAKLDALGLRDLFDVVVVGDEHGRAWRKPAPHSFLAVAAALDLAPSTLVSVGDHPKDAAGAVAAGCQSIRVRTGEHGAEADVAPVAADVADVPAAVAAIVSHLDACDRGTWPSRRPTQRPVRPSAPSTP